MQDPKALETIVSELVAIKRLLAFALMRSGASQAELASALGIAQQTVSRQFGAVGKSKKIK